ncbi:hypothetical protein CAPTEDRAFT_118503 [Capitella teleta]|uniref:F-box/LRR-repeat protein 15-like leucin rich repeat domain-containing protein n=1 Tax=Capitella teleta TaxID=283909 RepID=R7VDT7_CAPTE|nr:hypothetical protein CAPTEDRAFT_118503 [Capitella teleta]|eukprot:ELU17013.1 hypothetical protein CAPTEDRAFT_118503 [Capitella teleta]
MEAEIHDEPFNILTLPWEDVLFPHVFIFLGINDLFKVRATCSLGHQCVEEYFTCIMVVNTVRLSSKFNAESFRIVSSNARCIRRLLLRNCKTWLTDRELVPVLGANQKLLSIDLTNCTNVTNSSIQKLAISCTALEELRLKDCHWLSADSIVVLGMNCQQLKYVDIAGCWEVTDDALGILLMRASKLSYLSIAKIYGLTDRSISCLAKACQNLRHLNMQGCWRVTDDSVRLLGEYCKSLKGLQVRECRDVTQISLARLRAKGIRVDVPQAHYSMNPENIEYLRRLSLQI